MAEAHNNLGNALKTVGRLIEAEECYRRALALQPSYAEAHHNLGSTLTDLGRSTEAEQSYRNALRIKPDFAEAHARWIHQRQHLCAWPNLVEEMETLRQRVTSGQLSTVSPFSFLVLPGTTASEQYVCARQFVAKSYSYFLSRRAMSETRLHPGHSKLRIGYLSADYFEHATSYLLAEVIEFHDRSRFEVIAYSYGPEGDGATGKRMRGAFDEFRDIRDSSDKSAARRIYDDKVDILVDLKGHSGPKNRIATAQRPAPMQVNWLGYPGTLGNPRLADYVIGDPIVTPLEHASYYSENLALLPNCYQPNDRQRSIGRRPTRAEAGLPEDGIVFCCFNQSYKITPEIFDLWCRLLKNVPESVLWLLQPVTEAKENLYREAALRGIAAQRIVFAPRLRLSEHLGRLQLADLALDTFPYTSHTTASDALWAGVPLVTQLGDTFVSRVAGSVLHTAGLPELVTYSSDSYYHLALGLVGNSAELKALRTKLVTNRLTCPLFDSKRFTRNLERLFDRMWANHREGRQGHIVIEG